MATGIVSVGDSWACTNPSLARGITMGLMHALGTVEVVKQHLDNPLALMLAQDSMTETRLTPWYRNTIEIDRTRIARLTRRSRVGLNRSRQTRLPASPTRFSSR